MAATATGASRSSTTTASGSGAASGSSTTASSIGRPFFSHLNSLRPLRADFQPKSSLFGRTLAQAIRKRLESRRKLLVFWVLFVKWNKSLYLVRVRLQYGLMSVINCEIPESLISCALQCAFCVHYVCTLIPESVHYIGFTVSQVPDLYTNSFLFLIFIDEFLFTIRLAFLDPQSPPPQPPPPSHSPPQVPGQCVHHAGPWRRRNPLLPGLHRRPPRRQPRPQRPRFPVLPPRPLRGDGAALLPCLGPVSTPFPPQPLAALRRLCSNHHANAYFAFSCASGIVRTSVSGAAPELLSIFLNFKVCLLYFRENKPNPNFQIYLPRIATLTEVASGAIHPPPPLPLALGGAVPLWGACCSSCSSLRCLCPTRGSPSPTRPRGSSAAGAPSPT